MARTKKKQYKARKGGSLNNKEAHIVGEEIEKLMKSRGGEIQPAELVKEAKKKTSKLHQHFDWDNGSAAQKFRLQQARQLIANVVEVTMIKNEKIEHRSFYNVKNAKQKRVYVNVQTTISKPKYVTQVINDCESYMENFLRTLKLLRNHLK